MSKSFRAKTTKRNKTCGRVNLRSAFLLEKSGVEFYQAMILWGTLVVISWVDSITIRTMHNILAPTKTNMTMEKQPLDLSPTVFKGVMFHCHVSSHEGEPIRTGNHTKYAKHPTFNDQVSCSLTDLKFYVVVNQPISKIKMSQIGSTFPGSG